MIQLNRMPDYNTPLLDNGAVASGWFRLWQGLWSGTPTQNLSAVTPGASPFTYRAPAGGSLIVQGGTVSQVQFSRDGTAFFTTGQTQGMFPVSQGDALAITYSAAPTLNFVPR